VSSKTGCRKTQRFDVLALGHAMVDRVFARTGFHVVPSESNIIGNLGVDRRTTPPISRTSSPDDPPPPYDTLLTPVSTYKPAMIAAPAPDGTVFHSQMQPDDVKDRRKSNFAFLTKMWGLLRLGLWFLGTCFVTVLATSGYGCM
jgi:hypothetical protein